MHPCKVFTHGSSDAGGLYLTILRNLMSRSAMASGSSFVMSTFCTGPACKHACVCMESVHAVRLLTVLQPQATRQHALPWQHALLLMACQTAGEPIACGRRFDAFEGSHLVLRANLREHIAEQLQQLLGALLTAQRTEEQGLCVCWHSGS